LVIAFASKVTPRETKTVTPPTDATPLENQKISSNPKTYPFSLNNLQPTTNTNRQRIQFKL